MAAEYECDLLKKVCCSQEVRSTFNKAVLETYGFNHEEAIRLFEVCLSVDSNCAMAHYFIAHCFAPNYNNPDGLDAMKPYEHSQMALALTKTNSLFSTLEIALIEAQALRFCAPGSSIPQDVLTKNYASAMRDVFKAYKTDPDVISFFAESLMMLAPWTLWTPPPNITAALPETLELVSLLEKGLKNHPEHPALCHYYTHTMELSATPEKAMPAADILRVRYNHGHLLHMASHIDMWVGHYNKAIESNVKAIEADEKYRRESGQENNFYKVYRMHNYHFLAWAAMFNGQFDIAIKSAEEAYRQLDKEAVTFEMGSFSFGSIYLESFSTIPWHVLVRFGKWKEIIERPRGENMEIYPCYLATSHYARGVAFAALGMLEEAEKERKEFRKALQNQCFSNVVLMNNKMHDSENRKGILNVAEAVLDGEVEYHKGNHQLAFQHLRLAVERDTALMYDEPWGWMMPARHALGALLLEQGECQEAELVYREDLKTYKDNLWALLGLSKALYCQGKTDEAATVRKTFEIASSQADVDIKASCFCATKSM